MVIIGIFLAFLYWGLESFLNVFSPDEISFYRELFGPNVSEIWMRLIVLSLFLIFGSHVRFTINNRKKAEKALKASEEKYRTILESIEEGYYELDFDKKFTFTNDSMSKIVGRPKPEILRTNFQQLIDDRDVARVQHIFNTCRSSGEAVKAFDCEFSRDNFILFIEASVALLKNSKDEPIGYRGMVRDRTEKKKLEMDLLESYHKIQAARSATILGLAKLAEYRDEGTGTHLERMREYARLLTEQMGRKVRYREIITSAYIDDIYQSSILHDIGKVGIPDAILLKPGRLNLSEFEIIKRHTVFGGDAIKAIESQIQGRSFLFMGKEIAYYHHEKWDGSGYPEARRGESIPLSARIVALADVYDALTTKRFYKQALSHEDSKHIRTDLIGTHFDPDVGEAFLKLEDEFNRIRQEKLKEEMHLIENPARAYGS
jgi:PAS domain S-box-containing protein